VRRKKHAKVALNFDVRCLLVTIAVLLPNNSTTNGTIGK